MVTHLLERLPLDLASTVMDVYCGVGLFSAFLAPRVERLIGIETSPLACEDFVVNLDEFDNIELYEASAEQVLPGWEPRPDIILVDPPRSGLALPVVDAILRLSPSVLAYVSCDPSTLGRDAKRLSAGGYHLVRMTPFDMFPQTYHIESISLWEKE
jgi:23S rRNA (uracil1939-C5)-methyltransferase